MTHVKSAIRLAQTALGVTAARLANLSTGRAVAATIAPIVWDDFRQEALTETASGHPWLVMPGNGDVRVPPVVIDRMMTAIDTGKKLTAAYPAIDFGSVPRQVMAEISFNRYSPETGSATLILTRTLNRDSNISHIVEDGAVHIAFTGWRVDIGLYKNRDNFTPKRFYYPLAIGPGPTHVGFDIEGERLTLMVPGRKPLLFEHPRVAELAGRYVTFEPYWERGQAQPRFHRIQIA